MRRAEALAGAGQVHLTVNILDQTEIGQLGDVAIIGDEDIVRLDVAVDQALFMSTMQPTTDLLDQANRFTFGQRAGAIDPLAKRFAMNVFHDQEWRVAGAAIVDRLDDVGMVDQAGDAEFLLEALEQQRISRRLSRDNLDGNDIVRGQAAGTVDRSHAPFGDEIEQFVVADGFRLCGHIDGHNRLQPHGRCTVVCYITVPRIGIQAIHLSKI